MPTLERPRLTFKMLQAGLRGGIFATQAIKELFGPDNYAQFRKAGKKQEYILEEDKQRVDKETYTRFEQLVDVCGRSGQGIWDQSIERAERVINNARLVLFPDQDRTAALVTKLVIGERRPSAVLERLTRSGEFMGAQYKYEQGTLLALTVLCAELISSEPNGAARAILDHIDTVLEHQFFIDKKSGDPKPYPVFSYHEPDTNKLRGLSKHYPDPRFSPDSWVKSLEYPVREIGLRRPTGSRLSVRALYDPREKEIESGVIKALNRSLTAMQKTNPSQPNGEVIEVRPYNADRYGLRLVLMEGGIELRDEVTAQLEELFKAIAEVTGIENDDEVNPINGGPNRVKFRKRKIFISELSRPIELIVQALPDYIASQYEAGEFDPKLGRHNGQAWDLYKLGIVGKVAPYLWPPQIFRKRDPMTHLRLVPIIEGAEEAASYEYANRLGRKQRIYPPLY